MFVPERLEHLNWTSGCDELNCQYLEKRLMEVIVYCERLFGVLLLFVCGAFLAKDYEHVLKICVVSYALVRDWPWRLSPPAPSSYAHTFPL